MAILFHGLLVASPGPLSDNKPSVPEGTAKKAVPLRDKKASKAKSKLKVSSPKQEKVLGVPGSTEPVQKGAAQTPDVPEQSDAPKSLADLWSAIKVFSIQQEQNQEKIAFEWTSPTDAALFVRGNRVFFVFSQKASFDTENLTKKPTLWHDFQALSMEQGSGICVSIDPEAQAHYGKRDGAWTLRIEVPDYGADQNMPQEDEIKEQEYVTTLSADTPPEVQVHLDASSKFQSHPLTLTDPVTKETFVVFTDSGRQMEARHFKDFEMIPSIRGLVLLKKGDTFVPKITDKGTVVLSSDVSPASDRDTARKKAAPPPPITAKMWQQATRDDKHIHTLRNERHFEGDNLNHDEFINDHKELALYDMARGDMGEALNVLEYLDEKEPKARNDPLVRLLRAISHAHLRQADLTSDLLKEQADDGEEHAVLWQGVADMLEERYHEGLKKTVERLQILKEYPQVVTNPVYLQMAFGAYRINYPGLLFLNLIDQSRLQPFEKELFDYLHLFLAPRTQDHDKMVESYAKNAKTIQVRAEATFALVSQHQDTWDTKTQIKTLEDIRFLWRKNSLEMNVAAKLADLYAKDNQPEKALFLYRMIKEQFEAYPGYKTLVDKGENYFCDAFMQRDKRPLFMTVAMYDRFKEMLPEGPRQFQVIDQLSKDYETLGFFTQAQRSLQYLIQKTPQDDKKAAYMMQLAKIQDKTSDTKGLQSTLAQLKALPPQHGYALPMLYLESDVLAQTGHREQALALLGNDGTFEGLKHRLHLAWDLSNWTLVRSLLTQLIAHKDASSQDQNKYLVNLAVTLNLLKDRPALHMLRTTFLPRMEKTPQGTLFDLLTLAPLETPSQATKQAFQEQLAKVQKFQELLSKLAANPDQKP